eukprot:gene900-404_t
MLNRIGILLVTPAMAVLTAKAPLEKRKSFVEIMVFGDGSEHQGKADCNFFGDGNPTPKKESSTEGALLFSVAGVNFHEDLPKLKTSPVEPPKEKKWVMPPPGPTKEEYEAFRVSDTGFYDEDGVFRSKKEDKKAVPEETTMDTMDTKEVSQDGHEGGD